MLPLFLIGIFWETGIADCLANTRSVQEKLDGATAVFSGKVVSLSTISENPDIPGTFLDKYVVLGRLAHNVPPTGAVATSHFK